MKMNKNKYVIYGASGGGRKVYQTLKNTGIDIDFFVDSDSSKCGKKFEGKFVKEPNEIDKYKQKIIIASELSQEEIEDKLIKLNLYNNIIMKEEILLWHLQNKIEKYFIKEDKIRINNKKSVFIELLEGTPKFTDGILSYSIDIASILQKKNMYVKILSTEKFPFPKGKEKLFQAIETSYENYWEDVIKLAKIMEQNLPCVIILNKQMQMLYAAILLKKKYPQNVKIISVLHNDSICLYKRSVIIKDNIDIFVGTTKHIKDKLLENNISCEKVVYKEMPIANGFIYERKYPSYINKIKIGYAGRLKVIQKRADLIIDLIKKLELKNIIYEFHIAGTGTVFNDIKDFIYENKLGNKVFLYGQLPHEEIQDFWRSKDIFVATSDKEGTCLSMMEAMASGAVPVVTEFTSSQEYVVIPRNGYVVPFGDMAAMACQIENLYNNPRLIKEKGIASMQYIRKHCSYNSYVDFIFKLCNIS